MKNHTILFCILLGTIIEWYDFSLLASFASIISPLFFPLTNPTVSLLAGFTIFASGFVMRPIGAVIFGHMGDRMGRKSSLLISILLMSIPTTVMGLIPTYKTIGYWAPAILIFLRLIQGIASSGEYPGAICFLTEIAPQSKRGLWGSFSMFGVAGGILLGSIMNILLTSHLSIKQISDWGWRLPFLIGLPLGVIGWIIRYKINESEIFSSVKKQQKIHTLPICQLIKFHYFKLITVVALFSLSTIVFYLSFVYITNYFIIIRHYNFNQILFHNILSIFLLIIAMPVFGYISDNTSRKKTIKIGIISLLIFSYPIYYLFLINIDTLFMGQLLSAFIIAMVTGPMSAMISEMFETSIRYSGISLGLNLGASIFGSTCPLIATYIVHYSGKEMMPVVYIIIFSLITLFMLTLVKVPQDLSLCAV